MSRRKQRGINMNMNYLKCKSRAHAYYLIQPNFKCILTDTAI